MDGVLCDSEPFIIAAASLMFKQNHNTTVQPEDFLPFTGTGEARFIGGVAEKYNVILNLDRDKQQTYTNYINLIQNKLTPLPGSIDFIRAAKDRNLKVAVASSADRIKVEANLKQIGFDWDDFQTIITGSCVTQHKPNPECFILAADGLDEPYENCLIVEDAVAGVQAGKAASCKVLGLTTSFTSSDLTAAGADWIAKDLSDITLDDLIA